MSYIKKTSSVLVSPICAEAALDGSQIDNSYNLYRRNSYLDYGTPLIFVPNTGKRYKMTKEGFGSYTVYSTSYPFDEKKGVPTGDATPPFGKHSYTYRMADVTWDTLIDSSKALWGQQEHKKTALDIVLAPTCVYKLDLAEGSNINTVGYPRFEYPGISASTASNFYALEAFSSKLKHTAQSYVTIIEAAKTVSMVKNTLLLFTDLVGLMIKRDKRSFRRFCKRLGIKGDSKARKIWEANIAASSKWMEYRYGWRPYVKDIEDHSLALAQLMTKTDFCFRVTGWGQDFQGLNLPVVEHAYGINLFSTYDGSDVDRRMNLRANVNFQREKVGVHYVTKYVAVCHPKTGFSDIASSFSLGNIPSAIYEATPLSWMADWFVPFGSRIEMMSTLRSVEYRDVCRVISTHYINHISTGEIDVPYSYPGNNGFTCVEASSDVSSYYACMSMYSRSRLSSMPNPELTIDLVSSHWKQRIGMDQMLDAYAVLSLALDPKISTLSRWKRV